MKSKIIVTIISAFILAARSLLGPAQCRFQVGCTQFAIEQFENHNFLSACFAIGKRLLSCNPLNPF